MAWALKLPLADEVIESGLVQDFDASLSGIGQELGAGAYSMRWVLFSSGRPYLLNNKGLEVGEARGGARQSLKSCLQRGGETFSFSPVGLSSERCGRTGKRL